MSTRSTVFLPVNWLHVYREMVDDRYHIELEWRRLFSKRHNFLNIPLWHYR